jgi:hypothetical protein
MIVINTFIELPENSSFLCDNCKKQTKKHTYIELLGPYFFLFSWGKSVACTELKKQTNKHTKQQQQKNNNKV